MPLLSKLSGLRVTDDNGSAVSGPKVYVYNAGTTTPVTTYTDDTETTAQAHPLVGDAAGVFAQTYTSGGGPFRLLITDASDATIFDIDDYIPEGSSAGVGAVTRQEEWQSDATGYSTTASALQNGPLFQLQPASTTSSLIIHAMVPFSAIGATGSNSSGGAYFTISSFDGSIYTDRFAERAIRATNANSVQTVSGLANLIARFDQSLVRSDNGFWTGRVRYRPNTSGETAQVFKSFIHLKEVEL